MSLTTRLDKNVSADEHPDIPTGAGLIGRDTEGRWHYYGNPLTDHTVYVYDSGDIARHPLAETPCTSVENWLAHVDDVCGWDLLLYGMDCVEMLAIELGDE